jgi:hypothetical protein
MKKTLFLLMLLGMTLNAEAQRKRLGFIPVADPNSENAEYRELAYNNIYETAQRIFVNTQRFDVIDRGSFNIVKIEKEFQQGDDLINSEIISQGKVLAAKILAVAKITTLVVSESADGKGYSAYITAEFKQIDVESGKTVNALQLKGESKDSGGEGLFGGEGKRIKSPDETINRAVKQMEHDLERWVSENFPLSLPVLEVKDAEMTVIAEGGRDIGLSPRSKLRVVKVTIYPSGKRLFETLALVKLEKNDLGQDVTKVKVASKANWDKISQVAKDNIKGLMVTEDMSNN